jgi:hypothetical protein
MLIVMLIILMATATAMFAIHATAFEVRASGHVRQLMQTQYVGESGVMATMALVDRIGPHALQSIMRQRNQLRMASGNLSAIDMEGYGEPPLAPSKDGYRFNGDELQSIVGVQAADRESLGGERQAYTPMILVDVYDTHTVTRVVAGERADGYGQMRYIRATYTGRGRTRVAAGDAQVAGDVRQFHEGASDARAHGVSGPFGGGG